MNKRLIITLALFLFSLGVSPLFSYAQEGEMSGEIIIASPSPVMTVSPTPDYIMPYPGLLPDSPFYILKTFRDRMVSLVIGDPLKKADFDLLQADKRVGAALILLGSGEKRKQELGISTLSKGFNYYDEAYQKANEAKKQGHAIDDIKSQMKRAGAMYLHMLEKDEKKMPEDIKKDVGVEATRLKQLIKLVNTL